MLYVRVASTFSIVFSQFSCFFSTEENAGRIEIGVQNEVCGHVGWACAIDHYWCLVWKILIPPITNVPIWTHENAVSNGSILFALIYRKTVEERRDFVISLPNLTTAGCYLLLNFWKTCSNYGKFLMLDMLKKWFAVYVKQMHLFCDFWSFWYFFLKNWTSMQMQNIYYRLNSQG